MLVLAALLFLISSVGTAFPPDFTWFVIFRMMAGLGVGAASITSPMYIAEVTPARIRGRMVSVNQFAIVTGFILVYFVNYFIAIYGSQWADRDRIATTAALADDAQLKSVRSFIAGKVKFDEKIERGAVDAFQARHGESVTDEEVVAFLKENSAAVTTTEVDLARRGLAPWNVTRGWRWMFGAGVLPSAIFLFALLLVPESPRWLVKRRREGEAVTILARVGGSAHAAMGVVGNPGRLGPGNRLHLPALPAGNEDRVGDRGPVGDSPADHRRKRPDVLRPRDIQEARLRHQLCTAGYGPAGSGRSVVHDHRHLDRRSAGTKTVDDHRLDGHGRLPGGDGTGLLRRAEGLGCSPSFSLTRPASPCRWDRSLG